MKIYGYDVLVSYYNKIHSCDIPLFKVKIINKERYILRIVKQTNTVFRIHTIRCDIVTIKYSNSIFIVLGLDRQRFVISHSTHPWIGLLLDIHCHEVDCPRLH